jgi:hypothetical protein
MSSSTILQIAVVAASIALFLFALWFGARGDR